MLDFSTSRTITVSGPAIPDSITGEPALQLSAINGRENLSEIYTYTLDCLTPLNSSMPDQAAANLDLKAMIRNELTVTVQLDGMGSFRAGMPGMSGAANMGRGIREISGIVTEASFGGQSNRQCRYKLKMQPWVSLTQERSDFRIFQNKTAVDIIDDVLSLYSYSYVKRLGGKYPVLVYQVQYGETDFAFIQRLMQEHGIYWFFEHSDSVHRMVLVDNLGAHKPVTSEAYQTLWFYPPGHKIDREYIDTFDAVQRIHPGQWTSNDFDFEKPNARLAVVNAMAQDTVHSALERYEWPGDYAEPAHGEQLARVRMEELHAQGERATGSGNVRAVVCGTTFTLAGSPQHRANQEYLVLGAQFSATEIGEASGSGEYQISTSFSVQPATTVFRAPRTVQKPRTRGPQSAIVTGPKGSELWTDQYGRVKLKFLWDRSPVRDQNSSCWVRVSYPWAGNNYGGINIPRVGSEVIVDFESGDPDRPIVMGRNYNALNMPPWALPDNATQSGTLSRSSKGGGYESANAIRFEDKKGAEELWLQAERDMRTVVENDESHAVGHDRAKTVGHDESVTIDHDRTEKVGRGEQVDIGEDRRHSIGQDAFLSVGRNHKLHVGKDRIEEIGNHRKDTIAADYVISTGGHLEHIVQGHHQLEAGESIERKTRRYQLQAGESAEIVGPAGKIRLDSNGITLEAVRILFKGPIQTQSGWVQNALDKRSDVREGDPFTPDNFSFSG